MKTRSIILLVAVLFVMVMSFTSCNIFHKHEWTDATCTTPKTCLTCGKTEGEALGHAEKVLEGKNATCTATGLTEGKKCSICGEITLAQETIPAAGHKEEALAAKAPTCTEAGLSEGKKCSACGEITVKQETIPAAGHKEEALAAKAPTCTETGLTAGKKCSECDSVLEAQSTVPATGHKYDDEYDATCNNEGCDFVRDAACRHTNTEVLAAEAATCTKTGLTEGLKCKDCEEILTSQEIVPMIAHSWTLATCIAPKTCSVCELTEGDALGHNWKPATCTDPKTCQRVNCGATEGEALGHDWKDATCTSPQICSVCTATQGEAIGHKWNNATCEAPKTCSVCKATEGSKLGHDYADATYVWSDDYKTCTATKVCKNDPSHVVTETANATIQTASATCTAGGSVTYTATFTKEGFAKQTKSTTTNKLDHAYGETTYSWSIDYSSCTAQQKCTRVNCSASKSESADITSVTTPATCKDPGKIVYTAKFENFASNTKTKDLPVTTNHHYVTDPAVDATCKEPGLTEGKHCDVCGKVEIEQTETALAPHTYDDIYDAECNVCENIRDAACRHTNTETLAAVAPTCTTAGQTEGKKCLDCGEIYVPQQTEAALGHDWADATCLSPKTCQRAGCGATDGEPNGHDYDGQKVTYTWNANNSKCTASIVCKTNPAHVNTETVDVVITTKAPTCTEDGLKTYTATFTKEGFATQTKEDAIKTEGHKYTVLVETVAPTCEAKGYTLYKCSGCDNTEQRDWQNSTGHTYGATSYEWNGYETCTATRACVTNGCGHTETATATATGVVTTPSTCTAKGTKTYTATFDKAWATVQTKTETLDKLVHGYGDTTYVWAEDYSSCTASRTCANCGTQTATATVTSVTTDPECEKAGKTVYTATFTQDWCDTKTHTQEINALTHSYKVENTEAEGALKSAATCTKQAVYYRSCEHCGKVSTSDNDTFKSGALRAHNYGDITYSWTDYTACTATRTCQYNDCQHHDSVNATVDDGETTTSATCTTAGVKTYTATFDKEGFETQTKTETISATGHTFGAIVTANDATCTANGNSAYKQCTECELYFAAVAENTATNGEKNTDSFVVPATGHTFGETVAANDATCTEAGNSEYKQCTECELYFAENATTDATNGKADTTSFAIPASHSTANAAAQASTCTTQGWNAYEYCTKCDYSTKVLLDLNPDNHVWVDNRCECGAKKVIKTETATSEKKFVFEFGANKNAGAHSDGSNASTEYSETVNGITLNLTNGANMYPKANDGLGNSCIKLGTGSKAGAFEITVPNNVTKVIISAGGYKKNNGKLTYTIGGVEKTVTLAGMFSDSDGIVHNGTDYTVFEIDTSTEKTISFTTVTGGWRVMLNSITLVATVEVEKEVEVIVPAHSCEDNVTGATCTENGTCSKCGDEVADSALGHSYETEVTDPTCEEAGYTTYTCGCGDTYTGNTVAATGHDYDETTHICANCGETDPDACFHEEERAEVTAPTCTTGGYTTYYCADCGEELRKGNETDPAHSYESVVTEPTCTNGGFTTHTCSACGDTYKDSKVSATGHSGYETDYKCDTCSAVVEPTTDTLTIEQAIALGNALGGGKTSTNSYKVTGVVYDLYNTTYGNMYLVNSFVDNESQFQIYGLYLEDETRYDAMTTKPVAGDTITIYGKIGNYNGTSQMANAILESHTQHGENHQWSEATCLVASICSICGKPGEKADHVDNNGDNVCDVEGCGTPIGGATKEVWQLVTNVNQLAADKQIIIVSSEEKYAMSTTQNSNNRGHVAITKDGNTVIIVDNVQIITLEAGTVTGTYAFNVGDKYLYAASSSGNQLKSGTKNANASWKITVDSNGVASIVAQGTSTRNVMQYNSSSDIFACYSSASQTAISIYVKTVVVDSGSGDETPVCESEKCTTCGECTNAECTICETVCEGHNTSAAPTKATTIAVGDVVYFVCESKGYEMSSFNGTSYAYGEAYSGSINGTYAWTVVAGSTSGTFAFKNSKGEYMSWSSSNSLATSTTLNANSSWNVSFSNGDAIITNANDSTRKLQWNASSPRFACYTSTQTAIQLYK